MAKSGPHAIRPKNQRIPLGHHFIKEWRVFRDMTVEKLSEATGMSTGNISALENRRQGYSADGLEKLADALRTTPSALLGVNPLANDSGQFWMLWERASEQDRETMRMMAERLIEASAQKK